MIRHRGTCQADGCGRIWRENCEHCLREVTEAHRAATGHPVHLMITTGDAPLWELREMTRRARQVLIGPKRGW